MKRVSMSTVCSHSQSITNSSFNTPKYPKSGVTENPQQETEKALEKHNEKQTFCNLISFQNAFFNDSHKETKEKKQTETNVIYHKLRYQSLNKNQKKITKNTTKTQSQKTQHQKPQIFTQITINKDYALQHSLNEQLKPFYVEIINKNTVDLRDLKQFSLINSPNEKESNVFLEKTQPNCLTNTTLQSYHQIPLTRTNLKQKQILSNPMVQIYNFSNKKHQNNNRLSTLQSYRIKSNLQETVGSTSPYQVSVYPHLENVSKLCESVKIESKSIKQKNPYKSQKNIQNKSFIRSLKDCNNQIQNKKPQKLPIKLKINDENQILCQQSFLQAQINQEGQKITSIKTIEPQKNKSYLNRLKTLAQCGNTIVSRYNNSSEKVSRLSESSIVFQASKDVNDLDFQQNNKTHKIVDKDLGVVSDGQIEMKKGNNNLIKDLLNCGSFSETINAISSLEQLQEMKHNIKKRTVVNNKLYGKTFLRSQRKSEPVTKTMENQQVEEIRFDLDTFIQYGSL